LNAITQRHRGHRELEEISLKLERTRTKTQRHKDTKDLRRGITKVNGEAGRLSPETTVITEKRHGLERGDKLEA
jgi:hypothetical protein